MAETITYGLIGKEDLALRQSSADQTMVVTLPDGSVVVLTKISLDTLTAYGNVNINLNQLLSAILEILSSNPTDTQGRIWYISGLVRYGSGSGIKELVELAATQTLTNKSLTSPKVTTAILDSNGNEIITVTIVANAVNQLEIQNAVTGGKVVLAAVGDDANITLNLASKGTGTVQVNGVDIAAFPVSPAAGDTILYNGSTWARSSQGSTGIVPAAVSGTPAQHALYRENVLKAWAFMTVSGGTPSITDHFNVSSVTDNGVGDFTLTWLRAFTNANYAGLIVPDYAGASGQAQPYLSGANAQTATAMRYVCTNNTGAAVDENHVVIVAGKQ